MNRDGHRYLKDGQDIQLFICKSCGYRFSNGHIDSNVDASIENYGQLGAILEEAKKLDSATEIKTVAGEKESSLIEYAWRCKKRGNSDKTIAQRCYLLGALQKKGANLNNPDSVETILATEPEYNNKNEPSKKYNVVKAYVSYTKRMKILWEPITVKYEPKQAFTPIREELLLFVNSAGHRLGTYLQVTYDTGGRRGEVAHIKWTDINTKNHTIAINDPEKNSRSRTIKVPPPTISRIQTLSHKYDPYIFNPDPHLYGGQFDDLRKKLVRMHPDIAERLKQYHIHLFRYGFAHRDIKQGKHLKEVQQRLGHKSSNSTDRYTNTVVFNETDYETARATTVEDCEKYGHEGWTKYDEMNGTHLYRRLKP
ncbi:MAG: site-specific integrase [Candidatus Bathyarchaeia archaeon]